MAQKQPFFFRAKSAPRDLRNFEAPKTELQVSCQKISELLNALYRPWSKRVGALTFFLLWFRKTKLWGKRIIQPKALEAPNSNMVHENWEYSCHGLIFYPIVTRRHVFLTKKLSLIQVRGEKCVAPGVSSPGKKKIGLSRETAWDSLSLIDWLGRSKAQQLVCFWPKDGNNWDTLTPWRKVLRSIFVHWSSQTAVIASNLHQWRWSTDQVVRSLQKAPCEAVCTMHKWAQTGPAEPLKSRHSFGCRLAAPASLGTAAMIRMYGPVARWIIFLVAVLEGVLNLKHPGSIEQPLVLCAQSAQMSWKESAGQFCRLHRAEVETQRQGV